ncbi:MAG: phospholipid/cholesterol/gamma-HCH transport system permease protein [Desulfobacteraceae bacterium Eth-SRB2]|nr:MAG: phospholipid/cholesterol/gamma-HCH transport system permease protein [Desulfobacteraceae bacterium Eth-SRB2]
MDQLTGYIGKKTLKFVNHILRLLAFAYRLLKLIFKRPVNGRALIRRNTFEQIYFTGVQALPIIIPISLIIGCILILQFTKVSGQYDLGKTTVLLIVRELGPIITAFLVILRSATAVTIEIGYMNTLHEIEAIEMAGIDPVLIICLPRLVGITLAVLCLFIVFDLVSILGGYVLIWTFTYIPIDSFLTQIAKSISGTDIAVGIVKAICFGIIITVTSLTHGFKIKKQVTEIPVGTSRAALESVFYCLVGNIIISAIFYM